MKTELIWIACFICWSQANDFDYVNGTAISDPQNNPHSRQKRYVIFPKGSSLQLAIELLPRLEAPNEIEVGPTISAAWPLPTDPIIFRNKHHRVKRRKPSSFFTDYYVESHLSYFRNVFGSKSRLKRGFKLKNRYKIFDDIVMLLNLFGMTAGLAWMLPSDASFYVDKKKNHRIFKRSVFKKLETFMHAGGVNGKHCVLRALCESGQRTPSKKPFIKEILHKIFWINDEDEEAETHEDKVYRRAHRSLNQDCAKLFPDCEFSIFERLS